VNATPAVVSALEPACSRKKVALMRVGARQLRQQHLQPAIHRARTPHTAKRRETLRCCAVAQDVIVGTRAGSCNLLEVGTRKRSVRLARPKFRVSGGVSTVCSLCPVPAHPPSFAGAWPHPPDRRLSCAVRAECVGTGRCTDSESAHNCPHRAVE
jgi:hypothetical protein